MNESSSPPLNSATLMPGGSGSKDRHPGRVSTGIDGLDYILGGGLPKNRLFLVQGEPGAGKTSLALQFLMEGARRGERAVCVSLSESREELEAIADSHGWNLEGVRIFQPQPVADAKRPESQYTIFHPSEIELGQTIRSVLDMVEQDKPARLVIDSLSELRFLARDPLQYRRQILALKNSLASCNCTVVVLDEQTSDPQVTQLRTIAHGVITLEQLAPEFGAERRRLRVLKMRGVQFRGGYHDFSIRMSGLVVYPRLIAAEHRSDFAEGMAKSGLPELDALFGGGLDRGTSTLLMGAAGSGKSAVAGQLALAAALRKEKVLYYVFDEGLQTLFARTASIGMPLREQVEAGILTVQQVDPGELSPGEFAHQLRQTVLRDNVRLVVIDSLNGYLNAMAEEKLLIIQLHELLTFLAQQGVVTILVVSQHGLLGTEIGTPVDVSYLADTVVLFRYFENVGSVRKAVSVLKKRSGNHERLIRELIIQPGSLQVGPPLHDFEGVLTGLPRYLRS